MKLWEVFLARVPFEDLPEEKVRPVLILAEGNGFVECIKMTSKPPRGGEYPLRFWGESGLKKPTTVRVSKVLRLKATSFIKRIGRLSIADIVEIQRLLS